MPRLTRTQKFADLHGQMANDKEEDINSHTLSSYQNRLDNVQNILSPNQQQAHAFGQPQYQQAPAFNQPSFQQNQFGMYNEPQTFNQPKAPIFEEAPVETPDYTRPAYQQQAPVFGQPQFQQAPSFNNQQAPTFNQPQFQQAPSFNNPQGPIFDQPQTPSFNQPQFQQDNTNVGNVNNNGSYFNSFMGNTNPTQPQQKMDFNSYFEDVNSVNRPSVDEIYAGVFDDIKDNSDKVISQKERDTYLNQTISDVNTHNMSNGQQTINGVVDSLVDEVRHADEGTKQTNAFPWEINNKLDADAIEEPNIKDDDFSNTVSMEISKIMDDITNVPKQEEVKPAFSFNNGFNASKQEEEVKPVFDAVDNNRDVVEIKNIKEVENEQAKENTMSSTIPFIVAAEDEEVLEDDEEDGSNTVLNVILIVLIVVLIAVLGLIVFYILKTKGIF